MRYADYFLLNQRSASGLTFKVDVGRRRAGEDAVCFTGNKQWHQYIWFKGRNVQAHRIIYELAYGSVPDGYVIDHINRNPADNRPKNLRAVTKSANKKNTAPKVGTYRTILVSNPDGTTSRSYEYITKKGA